MHPRRYETLILLSPNLTPAELEAFKTKVEQILEKDGAKVVRFEDWGRKALAYPVKKELHGHYVLYDFQAMPQTEAELKRNLKIDEIVHKHLTILLNAKFTDQMFEEEKARLLTKSQKKEEGPKEGEGDDRFDGRSGYYDGHGIRPRDGDRDQDRRYRDRDRDRDNYDSRPSPRRPAVITKTQRDPDPGPEDDGSLPDD
jgi:small subunit ribosomal protein S6